MILPSRWVPLRQHDVQDRLRTSKARFRVVAAGRRSGKTERAKRFLIKKALQWRRIEKGRFVFAAPVRDQAKKIYWDDLKIMVPKSLLLVPPSESELRIELVTNCSIEVVGMDRPERVEGSPLDGIVLDEVAAMRAAAWPKSVRPALSTLGREGWCWFIGKPKGRNHFWELYERARTDETGNWEAFHWPSSDILTASEITEAKRDLDPISYAQEYDADFVSYSGRAYYTFDRRTHASEQLPYDPLRPLDFCFDFNVSPGTAAVVQEFKHEKHGVIDGVIGEVWIPSGSNTKLVVDKLVHDWSNHQGPIYVYGDATGGNRGTAKVDGSDWDIVRAMLRSAFGDRVKMRVPKRNPPERSRVNVLCSRFTNTDGAIRFMVDPKRAPRVVIDCEGTMVIEGSAGELDKDSNPDLTHLTDALGYRAYYKYPPTSMGVVSEAA